MKVERIEELIAMAWASQIIKVVIVAVVMDSVFGCIRAVKEKKFNSCFGIDGAIRKISMLVSIAFLLVLDRIVGLNLIGFIPEAVRTYLPVEDVYKRQARQEPSYAAPSPIWLSRRKKWKASWTSWG